MSDRAGNLLLLIAGILAGLGALELGARFRLSLRPVVTTGEQSFYTQFDPLLGWRNRPHARVRYRRREYTTDVAINALGFRDVERSAARVPGRGRLLAIGDSFVEGYSVALEETVTRRFEAIGLSEGCQLEAVNAGVHAYSTDQEALWFQDEAAPLAPDVVALFVYYNDIINNIRPNYWGLSKPVTTVVNGRIRPLNLPLPVTRAAVETPAIVEHAPRAVEGSALKGLIQERLLNAAPRFYNVLAYAGSWSPIGDPEVIPDELRAYRRRVQAAGYAEAWGATAALLGSLGDTIRARGADPVMVYVPARFEISERDWDLTVKRYGLDPSRWDLTRVRTSLEEIAGPAGWSFLDLTPALRAAAAASWGEPYYSIDGHWNRRGHEAAARALLAFLRERALLPCSGRSPRAAVTPR